MKSREVDERRFLVERTYESKIRGVGLDNSETVFQLDRQLIWSGIEYDLRVGVTHATLPALDNHNALALRENAQLESLGNTPLNSAVDILLPVDLGEVWLLLGEEEWVDTTIQVSISGGAGVSGNHEDRADGAVLGEETSAISGGGKDDDGTCVNVQAGTNGRHGARLDDAGWAFDKVLELLEVRDICDAVLGLQASLVHLADSFDRVTTFGSLSGQHDAVGSVGDGISDIADFGTGWARVIDHRLEHLGGADDGLSSDVAHGDHLLLSSKHLSCGDLNAQISASNHDTISLLQDLSEVVETLSVLDLGDDLDMLAIFTQDLADVLDILATADE